MSMPQRQHHQTAILLAMRQGDGPNWFLLLEVPEFYTIGNFGRYRPEEVCRPPQTQEKRSWSSITWIAGNKLVQVVRKDELEDFCGFTGDNKLFLFCPWTVK